MTIWFASGNLHKKAELAAILGAQGKHKLLIPSDAGMEFDPEETGSTFVENALLKARELYYARPPLFNDGDAIIADDSGICVDALGGRPGIFSARYAGMNDTNIGKKLKDTERNDLLLEELDAAPNAGGLRTARFVCAMVLLFTPDRFFIVQETLEGEIVKCHEDIKGTGGFGYDPILFIPALGRTVAELSEEEKNTISHRAKAGKIIATLLP